MDTAPPIEVRLTGIQYAARGINFFEFRRPDGALLPPADAGAHVDLHLPNGLIRQYSVTNPEAAQKRYVFGVKRTPDSRGGSKYIFDELHVGRLLKISPPRNHFALVEDAPHSVFIAGGIGITPIWAMVQRLTALGRSWELHYSCRSRDDTAFLDDLKDWTNVKLRFGEESAGSYFDLGGILRAALPASHIYCCGPLPMLSAFEGAITDVSSERVHVEYFEPKEAPNLEGGFVVQLARSGREFVIPAGKSILEVLRDAGVDVAYSCEEGICGTCETAVISGVPDHRDSVLTDKEHASNKIMMICCSGAKSEKLVLDL